VKEEFEYFKVYFPIGGWEYYRKDSHDCRFRSSSGFWRSCGEPQKKRQVEVSKLTMLVLFGPEAVSEIL
jgi:hypothetical protein